MKLGSGLWQVKVEDKAAEVFQRKILTRDDLEVIKEWRRIVIEGGPEALLKRPDIWADHPLYGEWEGYRSSSFSYKGRIIYRIEDQVVTVIIVRITKDHNYKKKE